MDHYSKSGEAKTVFHVHFAMRRVRVASSLFSYNLLTLGKVELILSD